jgi:phage gp29-like protein
MYAVEQVLRDNRYKVEPADDSETAKKEAEFVRQVLSDMEHSLDDHISEALTALTYGFSTFEVVYKRRAGNNPHNKKKHSKYSDGRMGVRKLASRAQWTIEQFIVDDQTGDFLGVRQNVGSHNKFIPVEKLVHYRTTMQNGDPSGRSVLRNSYESYTYLKKLQNIEVVAIERELHGVPIGRIPAEYLAADATDSQKALRQQFEQILRDLKMNDQGYGLLSSDVYRDGDGKATSTRLMDIELITSNGTRNVDIDPVIRRYQHDIARSLLAELLMLGAGANGSYALSQSKTDLFLRSLESYLDVIFETLNKQLIEPLWAINGLDINLMPKIVPGDIAPYDLKELGAFIRNLNGAEVPIVEHPETIGRLMDMARLPYDTEKDVEILERRRADEQAKLTQPPTEVPKDE